MRTPAPFEMPEPEIQSLNPLDEASAAWLEVARRRLAELCAGTVVAVDGEQVFARIRGRCL